MEKKAVVFDLDGTLWDSSDEVAASWSEITMMEPIPFAITSEMMKGAMGLTMTEIAAKLMPSSYDEEGRMKLLVRCMSHENDYLRIHPGKLYAGVKETLRVLKKRYSLMIMSNAQQGYIDAFIAGTKLEGLFDDFACWGDNPAPKSVNIRRLLERNGIKKAVYVGDTEKDETETHLAGLPFVHATYGFGKARNPEGGIASFEELPAICSLLL